MADGRTRQIRTPKAPPFALYSRNRFDVAWRSKGIEVQLADCHGLCLVLCSAEPVLE